MPEVFSVDEMPEAAPGDDLLDSDVPAGAVPCPECGEYFKSRGLSRHLNSAHGIEPARKQSSGTGGAKTPAFAAQWAEFQRGAALFVSFACTACAAVLVEDADTDGRAIAVYCENKPKLRKQIQQALGGMDVMILVGALGGTARKMVAHHSIGARLGMGDSHTHTPVQGSAEEKMLGFLTQMDPNARAELLNHVFSQMQPQPQAQQPPPPPNTTVSAPVSTTPTATAEETPGSPPMPNVELTAEDRHAMAMAHSGGGEWSQT